MVRVDGRGNGNSLIQIRGLDKKYRRGGEEIDVLRGLNLDVDQGEFVAFMGPSGSGKTTLLNLLGGLDVPTHGSITVAGDEITNMSGKQIDGMARAARGIHFSDVQPDSGADRVSKCGASSAFDEAFESGAKKACGDGTIGGRPWRPDESLSAAAFRRTGTARGDCARDCGRSDVPALRRADRRFGPQERG